MGGAKTIGDGGDTTENVEESLDLLIYGWYCSSPTRLGFRDFVPRFEVRWRWGLFDEKSRGAARSQEAIRRSEELWAFRDSRLRGPEDWPWGLSFVRT